MSEMETHIGKLIPVELGYLTMEQACQFIYDDALDDDLYDAQDLIDEYDFDVVYWLSTNHPNYTVYEGILYLVEDTSIRETEDSQAVLDESSGIITYHLTFYNGGTGFIEELEHTLKDVQVGDISDD